MKPNNFCCCMFCFSFFGLELAQNTIVVYSVLRNSPIETFWLLKHAYCMSRKQKIVHDHGPSDIKLFSFVYSFDVCRAS